MNKGKLYLIPNTLSEDTYKETITSKTIEHIKEINVFIVENMRNARRYIKKIIPKKNINEIIFHAHGKHDKLNLENDFLKHILANQDVGLISDSGMPCIADPGSQIVNYAHEFNIEVIPLTGPSSILLALIASGMNGQRFTFHGYLPINDSERKKKIIKIERESIKNTETQIFIETPYRNNKLLDTILKICRKNTKLCIALDITGSRQYIQTKTISEWKIKKIKLEKEPCVFLLM